MKFQLSCFKPYKMMLLKCHTQYVSKFGRSENSGRFSFVGSTVAADGDCCHEIKRRLLLERKTMTDVDGVLKSRDMTLPTKVCLVKVMVFPVVTWM